VVLGRYDREYLRHDGPEHVLCFAPTRSGKGVGLVVPTLLTWPGSAIVHDIKGENWQLTSGFRALHGRVLLFDPTNPKSSAYNPLLEVRRGEWEVSTAEQNQAIGRRKSRPLGGAFGERREGVARPEFPECGVGVLMGWCRRLFGPCFARGDSCRHSSRGC
jgi:hypothetical protein